MYLYRTFIVSSTSLCVANKLPVCQQTLIPSRHVYRRPVAAHCCPPLSPPQWRHGTGVIWGKSESTSSGQTSCCFCPTVILNLPAHLALNRPWRAWEWEMKNGGGWRAEVLHPLFPYLFSLSVCLPFSHLFHFVITLLLLIPFLYKTPPMSIWLSTTVWLCKTCHVCFTLFGGFATQQDIRPCGEACIKPEVMLKLCVCVFVSHSVRFHCVSFCPTELFTHFISI